MKILIISDSHGKRDLIDRALMENPDCAMLIHAGDGYDDVGPADAPALIRVPGNCDRSVDAEDHIVFEAEGLRILVTHGNLQRVSYGYSKLTSMARDLGCDIAVFGHTHHAVCTVRHGVILINPGCSNRSRSMDHYISYAVLNIENGRIGDVSINYF